jgi:DeoR/GlpR family transcriptional regulator of sugar metabolism
LEKEFISVAELMQLFSVSRATAQRLIKIWGNSSEKLGGKVIIPTQPIKEKFSLDK